MLKQMRATTPITTLIPTNDAPEYLIDYTQNAQYNDLYYLGIKYATLETVTDDLEEFLEYAGVACSLFAYKWAKLFETTQLDYDPIANVDAKITETREIDKRHTEDTIGGADVTTTNGAAPMDDDTFHNQSKSNTKSLEHTDQHDEDDYKDVITTERHGNIGVTSTQDLIRQERDVADMNMLDIIMADVINFVTYPYFGGE